MRLQRIVLIGSAVVALVFSAGVPAGKGGGGQGGMGGMAGMGGADAPQTMTQEQHRHRDEKGTAMQKGDTKRNEEQLQLQGDAQGPGGGKKGGE